jgi:hypothetical protein
MKRLFQLPMYCILIFCTMSVNVLANETVRNLLSNGSFEQGAKDWILPANAKIDSTTGAEGKNSLRLDGKAGEMIDITRFFPVKEGQAYTVEAKIKTKDVKGGPAYLILEWARKDRTWLGTGAYPPGLEGTRDWTAIRALPSHTGTAPKGAGYLLVFLRLYGPGTAWFDDLKVIPDLFEHPDPESPKDGAAIRDNRPTFRWKIPEIAASYVLEISPDAAFRKEVLRFDADDIEVRPEAPLGKGTYFWRVRLAPSKQWSAVWRFDQQSDKSDDTTGPAIEAERQYVPEPGEALPVRVEDPSGVDAKSVRCRIDDKEDGEVRVSDGRVEIRRSGGWKRLNWVTLTAKDIRGNETRERFPVTCVKVPHRVSFRKDGIMLYDGKAVFPIGIYQVRGEERLNSAKATGFDLVHDYQWCEDPDDIGARKYLDQVEKAGLNAYMEFDRGTNPRKNGLVQENFDMVARRVAALMDHPALFIWYLCDEPEGKFIRPALMRKYRRLINRLDPFHPTAAVIGLPDTSLYHDGMDWHWSESYCDTGHIAVDFDGRGAGLKGTPQCALNRTQGDIKKPDGTPQSTEYFHNFYRSQAYMGIAHGSNGLMYWWWSWQPEEMSCSAKREGIARLIKEIRFLEPVLTAEGKVTHPAVRPAGIIHTWAKEVKGRRTIIAVNPAGSPVEAKISVGISGQVKVLFENREIMVKNGMVTDRFNADSAHVYEVPLETVRK